MRAEFIALVIGGPIIILGVVTYLTATKILTGTLAMIIWAAGLLVSVAFDTWVSTHYTLRRLHQEHEREAHQGGEKH